MRLVQVLFLLLWGLLGPAWAAETSSEPYPVTVWARVTFGNDGACTGFRLVDEEKLPVKFAEGVKSRLAKARIRPPDDAGAPATFQTGVRLEFVVNPSEGGGSVSLTSLHIEPLPVKTYYASYPDDIAKTGGWEGSVTATCSVGVDGTCTAVHVKALPGMPESVRRFAKASLEKWLFEPQLLNGKPVEGEYTQRISLRTLDSAPENFRQPKLQRILQGR